MKKIITQSYYGFEQGKNWKEKNHYCSPNESIMGGKNNKDYKIFISTYSMGGGMESVFL